MNAPVRLGLYAGALALVFGVASLVAPDAPSSAASGQVAESNAGHDDSHGGAAEDGGAAEGGAAAQSAGAVTGVTGSDRGYTLTDIQAPTAARDAGTLSAPPV
ncbi:hypothetical protein [Microbacterium kunmingense]|uniref:hypothetical protein n=1 Tax=Microbacterium kunmingense TaxID=2915939 RepID=UPI002005303B|nr:hypothetical protein [Microbacterium kunmingense]